MKSDILRAMMSHHAQRPMLGLSGSASRAAAAFTKSQGMQALAAFSVAGLILSGMNLFVVMANNEELRRAGGVPENTKAAAWAAALGVSMIGLTIAAFND